MPNIKKQDKKRVFSICMSDSVLKVIDMVAQNGKTSRSIVIESVMRGWIDAAVAKSFKEKEGKENESTN